MFWEDQLLALYDKILRHGDDRMDRTGVGTRALFGERLEIELLGGMLPLATTKRVPFKAVLTELLWFIEGSGDERRLAELLHGTRDPEKKTIWSPNAEHTSGSSFKPAFKGDLGRVYGVQWRNWQSFRLHGYEDYLTHDDGSTTYFGAKVLKSQIDQLQQVADKLVNNPTDRRIVLSAWNPGELDQMALPPCHMFAQFFVTSDRRLSCQMYQRSVDSFLGLPFNIASYALLTYMLAYTTGCIADRLIMVLGDTHIYHNHFDQVREQLRRTTRVPPIIEINGDVPRFDQFTTANFNVLNYNPHPPIKAEMAA
jgi:thymidylate synthase